mmetsp:Transcript_62228/g.148478  ORF Transcript_62228/g.148478 Transcript_62228/m.148478 type:complete len:376 (+) Transcript_62228:56-1183(+)
MRPRGQSATALQLGICGAFATACLFLAQGFGSSSATGFVARAWLLASPSSSSASRHMHDERTYGFYRSRVRSPLQQQTRAAGGAAAAKVVGGGLWTSSVGKAVLAVWAKLAPVPPFSWMVWIYGYIMGLPKVWRYYLILSMSQSLASWLIPGIYAQLVTGTWLGLLKMASPGMYSKNIAMRLLQLFGKQAKLRGDEIPSATPEQLQQVSDDLAASPALADALGSVTVLGMWHKLEKTSFTSPELLGQMAPTSQARWAMEALEGLYNEQVKAAGKDVSKQAGAAETALKQLTEAVTAAARRRQCGVLASRDGSMLADVEKAGDAALQALSNLRSAGAGKAAVPAQQEAAWQAKLEALRAKYSDHPALVEELDKLAA